jgi:uncharacterized membrane protein YccC
MTSAFPSPVPWGRFAQDPRRPDSAGLRASDLDREVVLGVLAEAYADGRLDREEYDERAAGATSAKTLGDLPTLIGDLVPQSESSAAGSDLRRATADDLHRQAVRSWEARRRHALSSLLVPSLICWVIWIATGWGSGGFSPAFPWPLFVMLGTGANLIRVLVHREDLVAEEQHRLEKKQRKALEAPDRPPPGQD